MSNKIATGQNESMTWASSGTPGGRRPGPPRPAFWVCAGLVTAGAIYTGILGVSWRIVVALEGGAGLNITNFPTEPLIRQMCR